MKNEERKNENKKNDKKKLYYNLLLKNKIHRYTYISVIFYIQFPFSESDYVILFLCYFPEVLTLVYS